MNIYRSIILICVFYLSPIFINAQSIESLNIWGNPQLKKQCNVWIEEYSKKHPTCNFNLHFTGSDTAIAALYTNKCDLALVGREATAQEIKAFEWIYRYKPLAIKLFAVGSNLTGYSPTLGIYVNAKNSISVISIEDLRKILQKTGNNIIKNWNLISHDKEVNNKPFHVYIPNVDQGTGRYIRDKILNGNNSFDWDIITEVDYKNTPEPDIFLLRSLANDPYSIGIAPTGIIVEGSKEIGISKESGLKQYIANRSNIESKSYPLTRSVYAYINKSPNSKIDSIIKNFIDFILSEEGQKCVLKQSNYIPLNYKFILNEKNKIN